MAMRPIPAAVSRSFSVFTLAPEISDAELAGQRHAARKLQRRQTRVETAASDEFGVIALGDDVTLVHHHNALELLDRGQAMRDDDRGEARHEIGKTRLHELFV